MATAQAPGFQLGPGAVSFQPGKPVQGGGIGIRTQVPPPPGYQVAGQQAKPEPPADDGEPVRIGRKFNYDEAERVPAFEIDGETYTMLADPPASLSLQAMELERQRQGDGDTYLMIAMLGQAGFEALINGVTEWSDYLAVQRKVLARATAKAAQAPNQ